MVEFCIISELDSLSSSNCWKNNNKNHNIKSQNSHNIISRRFHWCWFLTRCYIRNKIKGTTCLWIVTGVHADRVFTTSNRVTLSAFKCLVKCPMFHPPFLTRYTVKGACWQWRHFNFILDASVKWRFNN